MKPLRFAVCFSVLMASIAWSFAVRAQFEADVTDGKFTNVYVFKQAHDGESWDEHVIKARPHGSAFTSDKIDAFMQTLMSVGWPSYFDGLAQYGIRPPQFFGSHVASQKCVEQALKDGKGVLTRDAVRSLANCHVNGMDPSPQVNLIFAPDLVLWKDSDKPMCKDGVVAYHGNGLNVPNFTVLSTSQDCMGDIKKGTGEFIAFDAFTRRASHEIVETVTDPAHFGHGSGGKEHELADKCAKAGHLSWAGFEVDRYWSDAEQRCEPSIDVPDGSTSMIWNLKDGTPAKYFTGKDQTMTVAMPQFRQTTKAKATAVFLAIQTGDDDLRGGSGGDGSVDVILTAGGRDAPTTKINEGRNWPNGSTHVVKLNLPAATTTVEQLSRLTINTHFTGGLFGDNWKVNRLALIVAFPESAALTKSQAAPVETWLDASDGPLIRFTGDRHEITIPVAVPRSKGTPIRTLELLISTGNDDLRGGSGGDNCHATINSRSQRAIADIPNANEGQSWPGWSTMIIPVSFKEGTKSGDVESVTLQTHFGGGIGGDNWNVQRVQLRATLKGSPSDQCPTGGKFDPTVDFFRGCECPSGTKMNFSFPPVRAECK